MHDQHAPFPLYLLSTPSDTFLACPTTPTLLQSVCDSSSETEDSSGTTEDDNGSHASSAVKNGEGLLCQEIIADRSEPRSDDDDTDPFRNPQNSSLLTMIPHATGDGRDTVPRHTPGALTSGLKSKESTLTSIPPPALPKSTSMVGLRRTMPGSSFGRTRAQSTVSSATPRPPPSSPNVELCAEVSRVIDDETRRLCEIAFLT